MGSVASQTASMRIQSQPLAQPDGASSAVLQRPLHNDGAIGALYLHADVQLRVGCGAWCRLTQCDGHERSSLQLRHQRRRGLLAQPAMHDVGIDAVRQGHASHGRAALTALLHDLGLELGTVETPLRAIGGSFARHGVHDLHRAHFVLNSASPQDVLPGRIQLTMLLTASRLTCGASALSQRRF